MDEVETLVKKYLARGNMMQVATANRRQPWVCTVYYVEDDELNLYWLSLPERRHSQEIEKNSKAAVAVPIKFDKPVVGLQAQGVAEVVADHKLIEQVMVRYVKRYNTGRDFYDNFMAGKNQHKMYKFVPDAYYLFDEVTFGDGVKRELKLR